MLNDKEIYEVGIQILEGSSFRSITSSFRVSNQILGGLRNKLKETDATLESWQALHPDQRRSLCYPKLKPASAVIDQELNELFEEIHRRLSDKRCHYSIYQGWLLYTRKFSGGWKKTQFYVNYQKWEQIHHPGHLASAPVQRQPGKYLYIDWIGDQIVFVRDPLNHDRKVKAHFLVFTLGYSSLTYAAAFPDEKMASVVEGINRALSFYGALPGAFRPDNMKTAVTSNTREGVVLSTAMEDLQDYYDVPVLPARPLHPKDKASVERAVLILETELLPELAPITFESFEDLNHEIGRFLSDLNTRIKTGESMSRKQLYERFDLPQMKPLPEKMFAYRQYKQLTVQRNCHIKNAGVYYSVPFQYVGQTVIAKISSTEIEICDSKNKPICTHRLADPVWQRYVTVETHLKSNYQIQRQIERDGTNYYLQQAEKTGPYMKEYLERLILMYRFEEQSYNSCNAILQSCRAVPSSAAETAAFKCLREGKIGYKYFTEILKRQKSSDAQSEGSESGSTDKIRHSNIRGKDYYK